MEHNSSWYTATSAGTAGQRRRQGSDDALLDPLSQRAESAGSLEHVRRWPVGLVLAVLAAWLLACVPLLIVCGPEVLLVILDPLLPYWASLKSGALAHFVFAGTGPEVQVGLGVAALIFGMLAGARFWRLYPGWRAHFVVLSVGSIAAAFILVSKLGPF